MKKQQNLYDEKVKVTGPYSVARKGNLYGILSRNILIYPFRLRSIPKTEQLFFYEVCSVETEEGCKLINSNGKVILPKVYQEIDVQNESLVILKEDEKAYRFYFPEIPTLGEGKISSDFYDDFQLEDKFIRTIRNGLQGAYSYNGREIVPPAYVSVKPFKDDILLVTKGNNKKFLVSENWITSSEIAFGFYDEGDVIIGYINDKRRTIDPHTGITISSWREKRDEGRTDGNKHRFCIGKDGEVEAVTP